MNRVSRIGRIGRFAGLQMNCTQFEPVMLVMTYD